MFPGPTVTRRARKGTKYTDLKSKPVKKCTEAELADAYRHYHDRSIRGAGTYPHENRSAQVGDPLPTMVKGPMTVTGFIAYAQGWGGLLYSRQ